MNSLFNMFRGRIPALLRLSTLASRFLLIFVLAKLLSPADVGLYSLLTTMSGYVVLALGFDFYTYSTRQILREPRNRWRTFLRSQAAFAATLYLIGYPVIFLLFVAGLLPWWTFFWFIVLVPLEHIGLELDRILIAMSDQLGASLGLFLRQATTPLLLVPAMFLLPSWRNLDTVLIGWVAFDAFGICLGLFFLRRHIKQEPRGHIDWKWIRLGTRIAIPFIVGTLCLRALFTVDRQLVAAFVNLEALGAYSLFMTIAAGMTQVISAGVHQFLYPRLVTTAHRLDRSGYYSALRSLALQTITIASIATAAIIVTEPFILSVLDHEVYIRYASILPWALAVTAIYNVSLIPHFGLYALDADRSILFITVASFIMFVSIVAIFVTAAPIPAVITGIGIASLILLLGKVIVLSRLLSKKDWTAQDK